jgi:hypothetical protein
LRFLIFALQATCVKMTTRVCAGSAPKYWRSLAPPTLLRSTSFEYDVFDEYTFALLGVRATLRLV